MENQTVNDIIFREEAHFHLDGFDSKQNCRICTNENPHAIHERPIVWCGLLAGDVIGLFFFVNEFGQALTVKGVLYHIMISNYLLNQLDDMDLEVMDSVIHHKERETIDSLRQRFIGRMISRNADINWPPRTYDLTPCDFFLWGFLKFKVYANKPQTIPELKTEIQRVIAEIGSNDLKEAFENLFKIIK